MASYTDPATVWVPTAGQVVPVAWMTALTGNDEFFYGDTSWTAVGSFTNSWANFGAPYFAAAYRKVGTAVWLRGCVSSGTIGQAAFTLPSGYRPASTLQVPCASNGAYGSVQVNSAGVVTPNVGSNVSFFLDSVRFDTI